MVRKVSLLNTNQYLAAAPGIEYYIGYTDFVIGEPIRGTAGGPNPIPVFGPPPDTGSYQLLVVLCIIFSTLLVFAIAFHAKSCILISSNLLEQLV